MFYYISRLPTPISRPTLINLTPDTTSTLATLRCAPQRTVSPPPARPQSSTSSLVTAELSTTVGPADALGFGRVSMCRSGCSTTPAVEALQPSQATLWNVTRPEDQHVFFLSRDLLTLDEQL